MVGDTAVPLPDTGFEIVRRGYDQAQVDVHLRRLDADLRILATDRDAAADQAAQLTRELDESRARTERLRAQVRTLVSPPQSVQGMSDRIRSMLRLAEDEVAEMLGESEAEVNRRIREAEQQAAQILAAARSESEQLRTDALAQVERTVQQCAQERAELEEERREGEEGLRRARVQAEYERAQAWVESEAHRQSVEKDFHLAMDQRRTEALAVLTVERLDMRRSVEQQREEAAAAARAVVSDGEARARRIVADAERRVIELTALRRRIVEQLGSTKAVLARSLDGLEPLPEERPEPATVGTTALGSPNGTETQRDGVPGSNGAARKADDVAAERPDPAGRDRSQPDGPDAGASRTAETGRRPSPKRRRSPTAAGATRR